MCTAMRTPWGMLLIVAAGSFVLGAGGTAAGGRSLSELPPVADPGPCVPPANSTAPVGLRGYRRFFANDSLVGRPVPCSRDDKTCFRHNLLFDPILDRCEPVGGGRGEDCDLRPNRTEFEHCSGRIIGVCQNDADNCPGYRMAYDDRCYRKEVVRDTICGCGVKLTRHIMNGVECRSSPATPIRILQPTEEGRCLVPDLRFPDVQRSQFLQDPFYDIIQRVRIQKNIPSRSFKCNSPQAACFSKGKVWVKRFRGCFFLLAPGPCPEEHIVALDIHSAVKGRAKGTCVHVRGGCPPGHKRMLFDGECHEDREISIEAPGRIVQNEYGQHALVAHDFFRQLVPQKVDNFCNVHVSADLSLPGLREWSPSPPCGANNQDLCDLYDVEAEPPLPEL